MGVLLLTHQYDGHPMIGELLEFQAIWTGDEPCKMYV